MKRKIINWNEISKKHIFPKNKVYNFFNYIHNYSDNKSSKLLRVIIKENFDLFIEHPFVLLTPYLIKKKYIITNNTLDDFYDMINNKSKLLNYIQNWYQCFKDKDFWDLEIEGQLVFLKKIQQILLSVNDCSNGGSPFTFRLYQLLSSSNVNQNVICETLIDRLKKVYDILGNMYFKHHNIPIFRVSQFMSLNNHVKLNYYENVINYCIINIKNIISQYTKLLELNDRLDKFLNPKILNRNKNKWISETENNNIIETKSNITETENIINLDNITETENNITETENNIIEIENNIIETENNITETENNIIEIENNIEIEIENNIEIETKNNIIEIENNIIEIKNNIETGNNIEIETENNIKIETENNIEIETENNIEIETENNIEIKNNIET
jgi:hypothetical protein